MAVFALPSLHTSYTVEMAVFALPSYMVEMTVFALPSYMVEMTLFALPSLRPQRVRSAQIFVFGRQFRLQFWSDGQTLTQAPESDPFQSIRVEILYREFVCWPVHPDLLIFGHFLTIFDP